MNEKNVIIQIVHLLTGAVQACPDPERDKLYRQIQLLLIRAHNNIGDSYGDVNELHQSYQPQSQEPQGPQPIPSMVEAGQGGSPFGNDVLMKPTNTPRQGGQY